MVDGEEAVVKKMVYNGHRVAFVQRGPDRYWFHMVKKDDHWVPAYPERFAYVGEMKAGNRFDAQEWGPDGKVKPEFVDGWVED